MPPVTLPPQRSKVTAPVPPLRSTSPMILGDNVALPVGAQAPFATATHWTMRSGAELSSTIERTVPWVAAPVIAGVIEAVMLPVLMIARRPPPASRIATALPTTPPAEFRDPRSTGDAGDLGVDRARVYQQGRIRRGARLDQDADHSVRAGGVRWRQRVGADGRDRPGDVERRHTGAGADDDACRRAAASGDSLCRAHSDRTGHVEPADEGDGRKVAAGSTPPLAIASGLTPPIWMPVALTFG